MALEIDQKQLYQALSSFNEGAPNAPDVVSWLRSSSISQQIASLSDDHVRESVHQLFAQRLEGLVEFLKKEQLVDTALASDIEMLVTSEPGSRAVHLALRVQDLLLRKMDFGKCPAMKWGDLSFERAFIAHFPPCFSGFFKNFTTIALLHEQWGRYELVKNHLNELTALPCDLLHFYKLLKQLPEEMWQQLDLVYRDESTGGLADLSRQSPFIRSFVENVVKDRSVLYTLQQDPDLDQSLLLQQLAYFVSQRLFELNDGIGACAIGFQIPHVHIQQDLCHRVLSALFKNKRYLEMIEVVHLMGSLPFFEEMVAKILTAVEACITPDYFQSFLCRLVTCVPYQQIQPERVAQAVVRWVAAQPTHERIEQVKGCLLLIKSPLIREIDVIEAKLDLKEVAPVIVMLMAVLSLFNMWQSSKVAEVTQDAGAFP